MNKSPKENHERYEERANVYRGFGYDIEKERNFIIEKARPIREPVLEIGTGKGHMTIALAREGLSFITLDISEEEQGFARLNVAYLGLKKKVDFRIANAESLPFKEEYFQTVFLVNLVHHLDNPYKVVDEAMRVLSSGGKVILGDFNKEGLRIVQEVHKSEGHFHEVGATGLSEIKQYLSDERGVKVGEHKDRFQDILVAHKK